MFRIIILITGLAMLTHFGVRAAEPPPRAIRVINLDGDTINPLAMDDAIQLFIFVRSDCPIANRYAPEIQRIQSDYRELGVRLTLVYPDRDETPTTIRKHLGDYGYTCNAVLDGHHDLVRRTGARVTPEAAVFTAGGTMTYCGRIDDWYIAFGTARLRPTTHDLRDALTATLSNRPVALPRSPGVGCYIADLQ